MLKVNKERVIQIQNEMGLSNEGMAKKLGLTKNSYCAIKSMEARNFTLEHILICQEMTGENIANFFKQ
ncbi:MAG: hypothetical protein IJQ72_01655 [Bacilli bacterium]|nr:hypothetical protein [Bacilli bacterium]